MKQVTVEIAAPARPSNQPPLYSGAINQAIAQFAQVDMSVLTGALSSIVDQMAAALIPQEGGPEQCEMEFGLKIAADGNIIISKIGGEMSMRIKLTWKR